MPVLVDCAACGKKYQAPDTLMGKSVRCGCGTTIRVPAAAAEPAAAVPVPSIFGEATDADFSRLQQQAAPAAPQRQSPHANPYQSPAAAMYPAGGMQGGGSRGSMPSSVKTAAWALGVAGGLSSLLAIFCVVLMLGLFGRLPDAAGYVFGTIMLVLHLVIAATNIGAAVMLNSRAPGARIVGFLAVVTNALGAPVHWICAIIAAVGLMNGDTGKYLAQR